MIPDINLIPQKEVVEQKKTKAVKTSTVLSILFMIVIVAVCSYFFIKTDGIKSQIKSLNSDIDNQRKQIKQLSQIEISGRNLDKKYRVLSSLFANRPKYSLFFEEFKTRKPEEVSADNLDIKGGSVSIGGTAESYIAIANFINNLLNKDFEGGNPNLKGLFTAVSLNSVNLEKATNEVRFFILVSYDEAKLKQ